MPANWPLMKQAASSGSGPRYMGLASASTVTISLGDVFWSADAAEADIDGSRAGAPCGAGSTLPDRRPPAAPTYPTEVPARRPVAATRVASHDGNRAMPPLPLARLLLRQMFTVALAVGNSIRSSGA